MSNETEPKKKTVLFCTCSGACPSMAKIDFWAPVERVRLELDEQIEFMALHPRLCEEDGERLMGQILNDQIQFITPACAEKRQEKLLRAGFCLQDAINFPNKDEFKRRLRAMLQELSERRASAVQPANSESDEV